MERFLKVALITIGLIAAIIWGAISVCGEEPTAKDREVARRARYERCRNILFELFPAELRSEYNCMALLADEGALTPENEKFLDESGRRYLATCMLWIEGGRLNEDLFGAHPKEGAKESDLDAKMKELHELGTRCKVDLKILRGKMPLAALMKAAAETASEPAPDNPRDTRLVEEALTPTLANTLALLYEKRPELFDRQWKAALDAACADAVNFQYLSVAILRHRVSRKNTERLMALEIKIQNDERKLRDFLHTPPHAARWREVWDK